MIDILLLFFGGAVPGTGAVPYSSINIVLYVRTVRTHIKSRSTVFLQDNIKKLLFFQKTCQWIFKHYNSSIKLIKSQKYHRNKEKRRKGWPIPQWAWANFEVYNNYLLQTISLMLCELFVYYFTKWFLNWVSQIYVNGNCKWMQNGSLLPLW